MLCTNPLPYERLPTITALSRSCIAPATISEADALSSLINTAMGISVSIGFCDVLYVFSSSLSLPRVSHMVFPFGSNRFITPMASLRSPPGLPLRSKTSDVILWFFFKSSSASLTSDAVFVLNDDM